MVLLELMQIFGKLDDFVCKYDAANKIVCAKTFLFRSISSLMWHVKLHRDTNGAFFSVNKRGEKSTVTWTVQWSRKHKHSALFRAALKAPKGRLHFTTPDPVLSHHSANICQKKKNHIKDWKKKGLPMYAFMFLFQLWSCWRFNVCKFS